MVDAFAEFRRLVTALTPYLGDVVLVGGWAAWMYSRMWGAETARPLMTNDFDWALPKRLPRRGRDLRTLLNDAEFIGVVVGPDQRPPVTRYQPARYGSTDLGPIYAEFLVSLTGPADRQSLTTEVSGVSAQRLRFMEIALIDPISVEMSKLTELDHPGPSATLRVPHPMNYLVHKLLTLDYRAAAQKAKDFAYLYQVFRDTRTRWDDMRAQLDRLRDALVKRWVRRATSTLTQAFLEEGSPGPGAAERVLTDYGAPTEEAVRRVIAKGAASVGLVDHG